jgi:type II secretory pathway pseudopilin PulG
MKTNCPSREKSGTAAFSLLEVLLAILIAVGLMLAVLYFYRQAADLRVQALKASERIRETRLVMQRLTGELRQLFHHKAVIAFQGDSNSVQFVTARLPDRSSWAGEELGRSTRPESGLVIVRYLGGPMSTNGLFRSAQPLVSLRDPLDVGVESESEVEEEVMSDESEEGDGEEGDGEEELAAEDESEVKAAFGTLSAPALLTRNIRFSRFRFWNGEAWQDNWTSSEPPAAIEISLGLDPMPPEYEPDQYPFELFRRVLSLPFDEASEPETEGDETAAETEDPR